MCVWAVLAVSALLEDLTVAEGTNKILQFQQEAISIATIFC